MLTADKALKDSTVMRFLSIIQIQQLKADSSHCKIKHSKHTAVKSALRLLTEIKYPRLNCAWSIKVRSAIPHFSARLFVRSIFAGRGPALSGPQR